MKKIILGILLLGIAFISQAQKFTVPQLISMSKMNFDDFDTYITQRGYSYYDGESDENMQSKSYKNNAVNSKTFTRMIVVTMYTDKSGYMFYQTPDKVEYLGFKQQVKALGYDFDKSIDDGNKATSLEYKKDGIPIQLSTAISELKNVYYTATIFF